MEQEKNEETESGDVHEHLSVWGMIFLPLTFIYSEALLRFFLCRITV